MTAGALIIRPEDGQHGTCPRCESERICTLDEQGLLCWVCSDCGLHEIHDVLPLTFHD